jgi:DNA-directed RNA polymerase specialized sigma24 family protein
MRFSSGAKHDQPDRIAVRGNTVFVSLRASGIDEAMKRLARIHPRKSEVVELRFFGGLSVEETAEVLNVSRLTVIRDWNFARAWLHAEISGENLDTNERGNAQTGHE